MGRSTIPVDLTNPGQVFACIGFMEAAEALFGDSSGVFEWSAGRSEARFNLQSPVAQPSEEVLGFLAGATVRSIAPRGSELSTIDWGVETTPSADDTFPFPAPEKNPTLPAVLQAGLNQELTVDHWGDSTVRDAAKFWAGAQGKPGCKLLLEALDSIRGELEGPEAIRDPFSIRCAQPSSFRLDWRRDYIPIDVGFSPNAHKSRMTMVGYPLVEILGAIGLTHARPRRGADKLHYRYAAIGSADPDPEALPLPLHRAALGGAALPFPQRFFEIQLGWPGKEGQARCILEVTEETA